MTTGSAEFDGYPTQTRVLKHHPVGTVPATDELELDQVNVAAAGIDLAAAGFTADSPVRITVTTDGPTTLRLRTGPEPRQLDLAAGTHDLVIG